MSNKITDLTRRDIIDLIVNNIATEPLGEIYPFRWYGRLDDVRFLERLYNLTKLPSKDYRYKDASGDIYQHRINNYDMDYDWVFYDNRFNIKNSDDETFLKFICEMFHPAVRNEKQNWQLYLDSINELLKCDGFEIIPIKQISQRDVYGFRELIDNTIIENLSSEIVIKFDSEYIKSQVEIMNTNLDKNPTESIGKSKELIESCCKEILNRLGEDYSNYSDDMTKLMTHTLEKLNLSAKQVDDEKKASNSIKRILGSLNQIAVGISELRNSYGSGHGKEAKYQGLNERHAKLAVGCTVTLVNFLWETYSLQKEEEEEF